MQTLIRDVEPREQGAGVLRHDQRSGYHQLHGRAVHCGTILHLFTQGLWVPVRFELAHYVAWREQTLPQVPKLYLYLSQPPRFEVVRGQGGEYRLWDRLRQQLVTNDGVVTPAEDGEGPWLYGRSTDWEDSYPTQEEASKARVEAEDLFNAGPSVHFLLFPDDLERTWLRWPPKEGRR